MKFKIGDKVYLNKEYFITINEKAIRCNEIYTVCGFNHYDNIRLEGIIYSYLESRFELFYNLEEQKDIIKVELNEIKLDNEEEICY